MFGELWCGGHRTCGVYELGMFDLLWGWGGWYQYLMTSSSLYSWWKGTRSLWCAARRRRRCVLIGSCFEKAELSIFLCLLSLCRNLSFIPEESGDCSGSGLFLFLFFFSSDQVGLERITNSSWMSHTNYA